MKKISLISIFILFLSGTAWSMTYTFKDIYANWPGWFIDPRDEIGNPQINDIEAIQVTIDGGYLTKVVIDMDSEWRIPWDRGSGDDYFDSLFITPIGIELMATTSRGITMSVTIPNPITMTALCTQLIRHTNTF